MSRAWSRDSEYIGAETELRRAKSEEASVDRFTEIRIVYGETRAQSPVLGFYAEVCAIRPSNKKNLKEDKNSFSLFLFN